MKKTIALILAMVMVLCLAACDSSGTTADTPSDEPQKIKATFVGVMQGGAAWGMAEAGFLKACEELGRSVRSSRCRK